MTDRISSGIDDVEALERVVGKMPGTMHLKVIDHLDAGALRWIAAAPLMFAGVGDAWSIDVMLGGGPIGFARADADEIVVAVHAGSSQPGCSWNTSNRIASAVSRRNSRVPHSPCRVRRLSSERASRRTIGTISTDTNVRWERRKHEHHDDHHQATFDDAQCAGARDRSGRCGPADIGSFLWLFWRSHADLRRNWSPGLEVRDEHALVTNGIYARMRHPMYAAIWISACAQPLLIHNWIAGVLVIPAFAAMWFIRVPNEEALMRRRFGAAYDEYCRRAGRLLPRRAHHAAGTA